MLADVGVGSGTTDFANPGDVRSSPDSVRKADVAAESARMRQKRDVRDETALPNATVEITEVAH